MNVLVGTNGIQKLMELLIVNECCDGKEQAFLARKSSEGGAFAILSRM